MVLVDSTAQTDSLEALLGDSEGGKGDSSRRRQSWGVEVGGHHSEGASGSKEIWMRKRMKKCLCMLFFLILLGVAGVVYFGYFCPETVCALSFSPLQRRYKMKYIKDGINQFHIGTDEAGKPLSNSARSATGPSFEEVTGHDFQFDIRGHDVIVFLHIQKTGGTTFGRHLVDDLDLDRHCECHRKIRKRCTCLRPGPHSDETWLFSRHSTGWKCGLHADWTELTSCVDDMMDRIEDNSVERRYFYITFLRDPVHRYLSEFKHVRRGATWKTARLLCEGRPPTREEVPLCYKGDTWENVTLEEFMACSSNLANNRQTRMLADLSLVGCYNTSFLDPEDRGKMLLISAKNNLKKMAFFGLTEDQEISQYIFEETFNLKFRVRFEQHNQTISDQALHKVDPETLRRIEEINYLDVQLYKFAKQLLQNRFKVMSEQDPHFKEHFENMGRSQFSWSEIENST
ncbi:heparan-sulfate 6-O-sulfotransferase 2-like [Macrobrachium nipponense]|uniref:heparan-sulfate 6-O-sulfotransferase 2-like n=1 Tax=Macrobrachium nipponense TaxID=159736 RepID=UPI0030C7FB0C